MLLRKILTTTAAHSAKKLTQNPAGLFARPITSFSVDRFRPFTNSDHFEALNNFSKAVKEGSALKTTQTLDVLKKEKILFDLITLKDSDTFLNMNSILFCLIKMIQAKNLAEKNNFRETLLVLIENATPESLNTPGPSYFPVVPLQAAVHLRDPALFLIMVQHGADPFTTHGQISVQNTYKASGFQSYQIEQILDKHQSENLINHGRMRP